MSFYIAFKRAVTGLTKTRSKLQFIKMTLFAFFPDNCFSREPSVMASRNVAFFPRCDDYCHISVPSGSLQRNYSRSPFPLNNNGRGSLTTLNPTIC